MTSTPAQRHRPVRLRPVRLRPVRIRPVALVVATLLAATALVGLGASAASATGTTFKTHKPSISGTVKVGHTIGVSMTTWSPKPTSKTYQWLENGENISGATNSTYALTPTDLGKSIAVEVAGIKANYTTASVVSAAKTVAAGSFSKVGTPKISGTAEVDLTLHASSGTWAPTADLVSYQWKSNKVAIPSADTGEYTLQPTDVGKTITVTVTESLTGYTTTTSTSAKTKTVTVDEPITKDGTHRVGGTTGLAPGTYVTKSSTLDLCEWGRLDSSKTFIASDILGGQAIVTVLSTDSYLYTNGCGKWIRLVDSPATLKTTFKSGSYQVGRNIAAGTYQASKTSECAWARLSGFTGTPDSVIDSDSEGRTQVTISGSDDGFESSDCGTWTLVTG
jgi:hypothetical protein